MQCGTDRIAATAPGQVLAPTPGTLPYVGLLRRALRRIPSRLASAGTDVWVDHTTGRLIGSGTSQRMNAMMPACSHKPLRRHASKNSSLTGPARGCQSR